MALFGKDKPHDPTPDPEIPVQEFEPHALASVIKQGGKKKLDTLLGMFKSEAPQRVAEIERALFPEEAVAAAKVLKSSAANLGLMGLEDACDKIIATGSAFDPASPVAKAPRQFLKRALDYLANERNRI